MIDTYRLLYNRYLMPINSKRSIYNFLKGNPDWFYVVLDAGNFRQKFEINV